MEKTGQGPNWHKQTKSNDGLKYKIAPTGNKFPGDSTYSFKKSIPRKFLS